MIINMMNNEIDKHWITSIKDNVATAECGQEFDYTIQNNPFDVKNMKCAICKQAFAKWRDAFRST